jgi:hypothetical protein
MTNEEKLSETLRNVELSLAMVQDRKGGMNHE